MGEEERRKLKFREKERRGEVGEGKDEVVEDNLPCPILSITGRSCELVRNQFPSGALCPGLHCKASRAGEHS